MSRRTKGTPGATPALRALDGAGVRYTVHTYEHDRAAESYGLEAAQELGIDPVRVFKTLLAQTDLPRDHGLVVAVVPVSGRLDLKALAAAVGARRAAMADAGVAQAATGYVVGGISPFGQRRPLTTVVDVTALEHASILVSGGRRGLDVEIAPADLVALTGAITATIGRA